MGEVRTGSSVYQLDSARLLLTATFLVGGVVFAAMADDGRAGPGSASAWERAVGYGIVGVIGVLAVRAWRAGVVISGESVVLRGVLFSRKVPLSGVDRFRLHETGPFGSGPSGVLVLRSGGHRWLWHIAPPNRAMFPNSTAAGHLISQMNADIASRRPHPPETATETGDPRRRCWHPPSTTAGHCRPAGSPRAMDGTKDDPNRTPSARRCEPAQIRRTAPVGVV